MLILSENVDANRPKPTLTLKRSVIDRVAEPNEHHKVMVE